MERRLAPLSFFLSSGVSDSAFSSAAAAAASSISEEVAAPDDYIIITIVNNTAPLSASHSLSSPALYDTTAALPISPALILSLSRSLALFSFTLFHHSPLSTLH